VFDPKTQASYDQTQIRERKKKLKIHAACFGAEANTKWWQLVPLIQRFEAYPSQIFQPFVPKNMF